jgi:hypothetical protein
MHNRFKAKLTCQKLRVPASNGVLGLQLQLGRIPAPALFGNYPCLEWVYFLVNISSRA